MVTVEFIIKKLNKMESRPFFKETLFFEFLKNKILDSGRNFKKKYVQIRLQVSFIQADLKEKFIMISNFFLIFIIFSSERMIRSSKLT